MFKISYNADIETIIKNYAVMTKFNSFLMIDILSFLNRDQFESIVIQIRIYYQQFHETVVVVCIVNFRSRNITSNRARFRFAISTLKLQYYNVKADEYRNVAKRFNLHVELHYADVLREYDLINHCNVFINEDKQRVKIQNFTALTILMLKMIYEIDYNIIFIYLFVPFDVSIYVNLFI